MRRSLIVLAPIFLLLAACSSTPAADSPTTTEPAVAPSVSTQFVTSDCAVVGGNPIASSTAPTQGITFSGVTIKQADAPIITIAPALPAATEVQTKTLVAGKGVGLKASDTLTFNYCGVGLVSQTQFDSSWARREPLTFDLGGLIPGWGVGMPGMKVGEQRLLIVPGALGYGPSPQPGSGILPDETLVFVVQLISIDK
jgi:peptidylprolyl isomerase